MDSSTVSEQSCGSPQPRIQITYPVEVEGTWVEKELPFVIGVLGDFSGQPSQPLRPLRERRFVQIDQNNFDDVMARAAHASGHEGLEPVDQRRQQAGD